MSKKRLTDKQVLSLRMAASKGVLYPKLSKQYGIHVVQIARIARGEAYVNVGGPITNRRAKKQATAVPTIGRPQAPDLASLSIDDAAQLLQALMMEWPKIKESFELIDRLVTGGRDE